MTPKPIVPRDQANRDVDDAVAYYLIEGAEPAAFGLIDALAVFSGQPTIWSAEATISTERTA